MYSKHIASALVALVLSLTFALSPNGALASSPAKGQKFLVTEGTASYYANFFHGRLTANGERFDMHDFTAAHRTLPFNSVVRVTNLNNGKVVFVKINDRGPYVGNRIIDLSKAAAQHLGMIECGISKVRIEAYN
ncbi:MAG: septal ring lytic transglycosylase RlpA family lipoprotein [Prosthecochloris sp.]|uniref:septal ring lytic transglycosylase RlpA family protein n=1 Tax=Prosthecochloris sp. TaxID=290513 RepID=UPI0013CA8D0D|nr:septal ring lytic transglycosylase RlpA family protein [Prosthecochloris sp.]NEX13045.1 septal ring lytic transglycosylase RlpA family lipoprotein [Prosthecochloris sp.]